MDNLNDYDLDPELCECTRLISNTFTINSAGISPATRQREQRARGIQRRMNIAPQQVNFDIKFDSPEKLTNFSEELSFYSSNNPASSPTPCPISPCHDDVSLLSPSSPSLFSIENNLQLPRSISQDSTSMDSGYSGNTNSSNSRLSHSGTTTSVFQFVEPKRPENSSPSLKTTSKIAPSFRGAGNSRMGFTAFHSLSSGSSESESDDFLELMDMESMDEDAQMPTDISSLISKDIMSAKTPDSKNRRDSYARKCLIMDNEGRHSSSSSPSTPKTSTITSLITTPERQCLQQISDNGTPYGYRNLSTGAFKRPEPPAASPQSKRHKSENDPPTLTDFVRFPLVQLQQKRPVLRKSVSMNDASIHEALTETNLIGDFSRPFCLPLVDGRQNLKAITAETMRKLLKGEFEDRVASYKIIDCRYPYEYEGGHIAGALNLYTHEQILDELVKKKSEPPADKTKQSILVFHCEFSSERGPKLLKFLRNHDRMLNTYPSLHYPEIYLLLGGYKEFYATNQDLCEPQTYRPMLEPTFTNEYKIFRAKAKSWTGDSRASASNRLTKSRSRLVL